MTRFFFVYLGHFALVGNQDSPAGLTTQKTKAPSKVWTSRSWWNEVPGHNEVRLINSMVSETRTSEKKLYAFL